MKDLKARYGPVALVTGASSGIGEAFTQRLTAHGFQVFAVARRGERLEALREMASRRGAGEVVPIVADLHDSRAIEVIHEAVRERGVSVDLLVNNAGFGRLGKLESIEEHVVTGMIDVNCRAVAQLTRAFLPAMKERQRGAIIIVSSVVGTIPAPWFSVYSATKAFDLYFGEALHAECRGSGVDVLTVLPGLTRTEFQAGSGMRDYHSPYRSAEQVVDSALQAIGRKPIVVDGAFNKLLSHGSRLLPRAVLIRLSRLVMRKELGV